MLKTKLISLGAALVLAQPLSADPPARPGASGRAEGNATAQDTTTAKADQAALRLIRSAEEMIEGGEAERGVRTLESVLERFPASPARYRAHLALARYQVAQAQYPAALGHLREVLSLDLPSHPPEGEQKEWLAEAFCLSGRTYYETRQYPSAFPVLRKLIRDYPDSPWLNQAHYYIGMSHFAQGNWQRAIESLEMVGAYADPAGPAASTVEIGRRLYIRIKDQDLTVATALGRPVTLQVRTKGGDEERIECVPLTASGDYYVGSIPTRAGVAVKGNGVLNLTGGDEITVEYLDENTLEGEANRQRVARVRAVSSGRLRFTRSTFEGHAQAAFLDQPLFLELEDADLDTSTGAETVEVKVLSRFRLPPDENLTQEERRNAPAHYRTRDEITLRLLESGSPPVRTGRFTGQLQVIGEGAARPEGAVSLKAAPDDEIIASYLDERHARGAAPQEVEAVVSVSGSLEGRPQVTQYIVADPVLKARKNLVEATAFLELGRIFDGMGLRDGAAAKCDQGLRLVNEVLREEAPLSDPLRQDAFRIKWELEIARRAYSEAIATCTTFSRLYPESPLVDEALLGIGKIRIEENGAESLREARTVFNRILAMENSQAKAEAQYLLATVAIRENNRLPEPQRKKDVAIDIYKQVADRYPDSPFAGMALSELVDYAIESKDFANAEERLRQVFEDHPDATFLDSMLLKWAILAYRKGDYQAAQEKCAQLLFDYPDSRFVTQVRELMPRIESKLKNP